jgi:hypothetical protein
MLEYVVLGVAVLFMGAILYGTWRRHETFTTMKGNYPPWSEIQRQVSAIFDEYYTYDLSEFAKIKETNVFAFPKKTLNDAVNSYGHSLPSMLISDPSRIYKDNESWKKFLPTGFVGDMVNAPVTTQMGVLEAVKKSIASAIKTHNPKKARPGEIFNLLSGFYQIEAVSLVFKNAVILAYMETAMQSIKPVPKTS